jgi:hypothetical protein
MVVVMYIECTVTHPACQHVVVATYIISTRCSIFAIFMEIIQLKYVVTIYCTSRPICDMHSSFECWLSLPYRCKLLKYSGESIL